MNVSCGSHNHLQKLGSYYKVLHKLYLAICSDGKCHSVMEQLAIYRCVRTGTLYQVAMYIHQVAS